ncbi:hypothetical protein BHE74_00010575 [Ensete ventricosum]|nr:hypothetical protein BHE74_00010575 [Ensete ventricosum]
MMDEGKEEEIGDIEGGGEGELDHHVISTIGESRGEDEVGGGGAKMPKRKRDKEKIICLTLDWSMHIYRRQDWKLVSLLPTWERLHVYDALLGSSSLVLLVASTTMHPPAIDSGFNF